MRIGIFSDVHANLEAMTTVLKYLRSSGAEAYVFLGDAVGYGANPNEVCDIIRPLVDVAVTGNHDAAVAGRMPYSDYYPAARASLDWSRAQLSKENLAWLHGLPMKEERWGLTLSHAAPPEPAAFEYLFAPEQLMDVLDRDHRLPPVTLLGHSHLTASFEVHGTAVAQLAPPRIECRPERNYVITVGSVGQPRDRDPRACCGIYETETRIFEFARLPYDVAKARQKILDAKLATSFADRLLLGT